MSRTDITDSELIQGSKGIQEDVHYNKNCDPVIETGYYMRDNYTDSLVVFYFRNCRCGSYDKETCYRNLENFRRTWIPLPTDGIFIHRFDCKQIVAKTKGYWKENMQREYYKYEYNCICRYTLHPNTHRHEPNDRGEFLIVMKYKICGFLFHII